MTPRCSLYVGQFASRKTAKSDAAFFTYDLAPGIGIRTFILTYPMNKEPLPG
jgi:hypothetical protein